MDNVQPPFYKGQKFPTYSCFSKYLDEYCKYFPTSSNDGKGSPAEETNLQAFPFKYKVFKCPRAGTYMPKPNAKRQAKSNKCNCQFMLRLVHPIRKDYYELTIVQCIHNHPPVIEPPENVEAHFHALYNRLVEAEKQGDTVKPEDATDHARKNLFDTEIDQTLETKKDEFDLETTGVKKNSNECNDKKATLANDKIINCSETEEKAHLKDKTKLDCLEKKDKALTVAFSLEIDSINKVTNELEKKQSLVNDELMNCTDMEEKADLNDKTKLDSLEGKKDIEDLSKEKMNKKRVSNEDCKNEKIMELKSKDTENATAEEELAKPSTGAIPKSLIVPEQGKQKGRKKGKALSVIGLKLKSAPLPFSQLSLNEQQQKILYWLGFEHDFVKFVMEDSIKLTVDMLQGKLDTIPEQLTSDLIDFSKISSFLDTESENFLADFIENQKNNMIYLCRKCEKKINDDDPCIECSICLKWVHAKCDRIKITDKMQQDDYNYMCKTCMEK